MNIDMDTILKIQKILSQMNTQDTSSNLLLALKPYMRTSRKDKIDKYAKILQLAKIFQNIRRAVKNNAIQ